MEQIQTEPLIESKDILDETVGTKYALFLNQHDDLVKKEIAERLVLIDDKIDKLNIKNKLLRAGGTSFAERKKIFDEIEFLKKQRRLQVEVGVLRPNQWFPYDWLLFCIDVGFYRFVRSFYPHRLTNKK